jgi:hypothetical protein
MLQKGLQKYNVAAVGDTTEGLFGTTFWDNPQNISQVLLSLSRKAGLNGRMARNDPFLTDVEATLLDSGCAMSRMVGSLPLKAKCNLLP